MSADPYGLMTRAVAFAVRAGHTDETAREFLERLCERGQLNMPGIFGSVLAELVAGDEREARR